MGSKSKSTLPKNAGQGKRFGVVASRYNEEIAEELLEGAVETLKDYGARAEDIQTVWVPGSFELPLAAHAMAQYQKVDAILCLGVIIKGETKHDQYIAQEVAHGIAQVSHASGIPVVFGVLTTETLEQAKARAGGSKGHKGVEAAETAVSMIQLLEQLKGTGKKPGSSVGFGIA
jgi:6,7-dimethyl-8-ribityllumazine synthase